MGKILIGTSSWAGPELTESGFYPPQVKTTEERLRYYAARFPIAEIDSSYHFFPTEHNLQLWLENTPADFTFDVRIFSLFTGQPVTGDVEVGAFGGGPPRLRYFDANLNGTWDDAEDLVFDTNNNSIFD